MRTWFITGVSSGFGRALAERVLADGDHVIGTLRRPQSRAAFEQLAPGRAHSVMLDVTETGTIAAAVAEALAYTGAIDVLVNNAGYGYEGLLEEVELEAVRQQFEVNVFGPLALIQAILPSMRTQGRGHIINITSMGGIVTFAGLGAYHASKFALEAINETLAKEVKDFGIHVTAVEPGGFRTDWAGRSMARAERKIGAYDALFEPLRATRQQRSGRQRGDPAKAAAAIVALVESAQPPVNLLLGPDALEFVELKLRDLQAGIDTWRHVSASTDFDEA